MGTLDRPSLERVLFFGFPLPASGISPPLDNEVIRFDGTSGIWEPSLPIELHTISFIIDGGGSVITPGIKGTFFMPISATILEYTLTADQIGSIAIDVNKSSYSGYPTTSSITGGNVMSIISSNKSQDSTLSGWIKTLNPDDVLEFEVDSVSVITRVTVTLYIQTSQAFQ